MTFIVNLGTAFSNDDFGVYSRSKMIFRGTLDECIAFRRAYGLIGSSN